MSNLRDIRDHERFQDHGEPPHPGGEAAEDLAGEVRDYLWDAMEEEARTTDHLDPERVRDRLAARLDEEREEFPEGLLLELPSREVLEREIAVYGRAFVGTQPRNLRKPRRR